MMIADGSFSHVSHDSLAALPRVIAGFLGRLT